jgi:hypothetical protein
VKPKTKLAKERAGAYQVADLICGALDKLPKNEQEARIKKIRHGRDRSQKLVLSAARGRLAWLKRTKTKLF